MLKSTLAAARQELRILSVFGYGQAASPEAFEEGLKLNPHMIVGQGTGTDAGPHMLATSEREVASYILKEFYRPILRATKSGVVFVLSGGLPGDDKSQAECLQLMKEISQEEGIHLNIAVIHGELEKVDLRTRIQSGAKMKRLVETERLSEYVTLTQIDEAEKILAQMGPEPIQRALESGVDGILAGRSTDVGLYMAAPLALGYDKAIAAHMGKTLECGAFVTESATPDDVIVTTDAVFGYLRPDHFLVRALNPRSRCTVTSVAAHSFYERPDPNMELNPGGALDITDAKYQQYDERTVTVSGAKWKPMDYTVKVEGIKKIGHRVACLAATRDPGMVRSIDKIIAFTRSNVIELLGYASTDYNLDFRIYGKNGVMGDWEPIVETKSHELGILIDAVGKTEEIAEAVCTTARNSLQCSSFEGRLSTAGNLAYPWGYMLVKCPVYVWHIWHSLPIADPGELFKTEFVKLGQ